jgi:hypothetical protein
MTRFAALVLLAATFQASQLPVGYWKLDDLASPALDSAGSANGTWTGTPVVSAAPLPPLSTNTPASRALVFDGSGSQFVEIPNGTGLENLQENSYTLAAWVRPAAIPPGTDPAYNAAYGIVIKAGWHEGLLYRGNQVFVFDHWETGNVYRGVGSAAHPPNVWYHVAAVWDRTANVARIHVDGTQEGSTPSAAANREYDQMPWRIGVAYGGTGDYAWPMNGAIDDVRIYNYALTATQIGVLAAGVPPPTGLTATGAVGSVNLAWTAPPQAVTYSYTVERRTGAAAFAPIGTVSATTFQDPNVLPFTPYDYRVIATSVADSGPSNVASATRVEPAPRTGKNQRSDCGCASAGLPSPAVLLAALGLLLLCLRRS